MKTYRIYAKLIGPIIPKEERILKNCAIRYMSLAEQKQRRFRLLEEASPVPEDKKYYKTYLTKKKIIDPRIIKTTYVMSTDSETGSVSASLGIAHKRFDEVVGILGLNTLQYIENLHGRKMSFQNYEYQISKIYEIKENQEIVVEEALWSGAGVSFINLPNSNDFSNFDQHLLERMLRSKNEIFLKSLKYLTEGQKGLNVNESPVKITLDFMKSMELIINQFEGEGFSKKLNNAALELGIDSEDILSIKKLWKLRSDGDVAHAKVSSRSSKLPFQFPTPNDVDGPYLDSASVPTRFLIKFFILVDSLVTLKITKEQHYSTNQIIEVNGGLAYLIRPTNRNRKKLTPFLKKQISECFKIPIRDIKLYYYNLPYVNFRILNHLKYPLDSVKFKNKVHIFFGSF